MNHRLLATTTTSRGGRGSESKNQPRLNVYSSRVTQPKSQGASQAMLYATGLEEEDMSM